MPHMSIVLVPIGKVDPGEMQALRDALKAAFSRDVTPGRAVPLPGAALNAARSQYDAEMVLEALMLPRETARHGRVLGVTEVDLYFPGMNFVFGIAGRRYALISLHRLRQPFYDLPEDAGVFRRRVVVEAVHELGHTFGLAHCEDPGCVMRFSNTIAETDRKGPVFCASCRSRVFAGNVAGRGPDYEGRGPIEPVRHLPQTDLEAGRRAGRVERIEKNLHELSVNSSRMPRSPRMF